MSVVLRDISIWKTHFNTTSTTKISDFPTVLTSGPHNLMPLVTKECVLVNFLYPYTKGYIFLKIKFKGNNCPLCVCPEKEVSEPSADAKSSSAGELTLKQALINWFKHMSPGYSQYLVLHLVQCCKISIVLQSF